MKMNIKHIILGAIMIGAVGCADQEQHRNTTVENEPAIAVTSATATMRSFEGTVRASGMIEALQSANLSTRMMGQVDLLNVKVGQQVKKGDLLLKINNTDLYAKQAQVNAGIRQAESAFINAEKDYQRFKTLFEKGSASQKELDDMTTRYEMAKSNLEGAKEMKAEVAAQFKYSDLRAPFDGIVINTFVKPGDMANPGMPLVTVEGANQFEATAMVSETDISRLQEGAEAIVSIKSLGKRLEGVLTEVSMSSKNTGGQYQVKIQLSESAPEFRSGMFINAEIMTEEAESSKSVVIDASALIRRGQLQGLYTINENDMAMLRWLRIGESKGGQVEVLSGLKAGEQYITSAQGKLYNGAKVSPQLSQLTK
ncbi:MAG: efflux RND transporter periplasmic adaptor subunit [Bacteroidota bacterium]